MKHSLSLGLLCLALTGCGNGTEVSNVTGRLLLEGKPVQEAVVWLQATDSLTQGMMICPVTNEDGTFNIIPNGKVGEGSKGSYSITINESDPDKQFLAKVISASPALIQAFRAQGQISLPKMGLGKLPLAEGAAKKSLDRLIPQRYWLKETTPLVIEITPGANDLGDIELQ